MSKCDKCKNCKDAEKCDKFYINEQHKATLTIGKDIETGEAIRKTFTAKTQEEALDKMYKYKLEMKKSGKTIELKRTEKTIAILAQEIEESFRIMKSEFKSRPVYHSRDEMIKAHFLICFLALILYRFLEKKLDEKYTVSEIIETLRTMELKQEKVDTYLPNYIRTDLTDDLHKKFGFRTDFESIDIKKIKKILKNTKQ